MKKLAVALIFSCISTFVCAQTRIIDSLENLIKSNQLLATTRVDVSNRLASYLNKPNNKRAEDVAAQALIEAKKISYTEGEGHAYFNLALIHDFRGNLDSAIQYSDKALKILPSYPRRIIESGVAYLIKAASNRKKKHSQAAIRDYLEALSYFEKANYKAGQGDCLTGLAILYVDQQEYKRAVGYYKRALATYKSFNYKQGMSQTLGNLGIIEAKQQHYKQALSYHYASLKLVDGLNDSLRLGDIYNNLGSTYLESGDAKRALVLLERAAMIKTKINDFSDLAYTFNYMGEAYENLGDKGKAMAYINKAHQLALKLNDAKQIQESYESLSEFYARNSKLDSAYYFGNKFKLFKDSIDILDNKKALNALLVKYEAEKKEQQINLLSKQGTIDKLTITKQKTTTGIIAGLFLFSAAFGGILYNRNKLKQKALMQEHLLKHQDTLTKAVIDAEEKERQRIAADLHDGVGQMFSAVKMNLNGLLDRVKMDREEDRFLAEKTLALVDESCKEVRVISHQMMPNMLLRSGIASDVKSFIEKLDSENLKVNLEANGFKNKIESNVETVLYRVIQETVNNVIKHSNANQLDIKLDRDKRGITAVVKDNGVGFNVENKEQFEGIGLKNIAARIEYLKGNVEYLSAPGAGTEVKVWVPLA